MPLIIQDVDMDVTETRPAERPKSTSPSQKIRPDPVEVMAILRRAEHRRDRLRCD